MLLLIVRVACGFAEAGAYPASARVISRWFPFGHRGRANAMVAVGGRVGGAVAPWLTVGIIGAFAAWRPVLWIYGAAGVGLAAATYFLFRDDPREHPWPNEAERALIRDGAPPLPPVDHRFPWLGILRHRGLWMLNLSSFGQNFGWALLVTWLPKYLQTVRGLSEDKASFYTTIALTWGMAGNLFGGWWCDMLTRRFGPAWGRRLPMLIGGLIGAAAYLACPVVTSIPAVVIVCGIIAFSTDSSGPATWAFGQDIGRNHVGATLAWSNMWGNFGAAAVAWLLPRMLQLTHRPDWSEIFWLCAAAFLVSAISVLWVDSTKPLEE
jgi:ACS family glucarate transporter-like MFS transporter